MIVIFNEIMEATLAAINLKNDWGWLESHPFKMMLGTVYGIGFTTLWLIEPRTVGKLGLV
jgi:hypothetical protein